MSELAGRKPEDGGDRQARMANRAALEAAGVEIFPAKAFRPGRKVADLPALYEPLSAIPEEERPIERVAGRLVGQRPSGGIWFADLLQEHATIQLRLRRDAVSELVWLMVQHLDIGDFLGIEGRLTKTTRGQLTLDVADLRILGKPLTTPPIGKVDKDGSRHSAQTDRGSLLRERRHIAMITDPALTRNLAAYAKMLQVFRRVMEEEGYLELQTSIIGPFYGGAAATPFTTWAKAVDSELYLRVSPEPDLKRALAGGLERVYEIGRNFRNEGIDATHQPSFTSFEAYAAWCDYEDMMALTERLVSESVREIRGTTQITVRDHLVEFAPPWPRLRMTDLVAQALETTPEELTIERLGAAWEKIHGTSAEKAAFRPKSWGELLVSVFEDRVEETLINPCFIVDHPVETSPLTKRRSDDPRLTERFEAYVTGMELANAYSELNDPLEQRARLEKQDLVRDDPYGVDEYFLTAIEDGLPQAGGLGIGMDRLAMMITGTNRIQDVVAFPLVSN